MGKTLLSYFHEWDASSIAQLYIHSEIPTINGCNTYYRVTDKDVLKSICTQKSGTVFNYCDSQVDSSKVNDIDGLTEQAYRIGSRRKPILYFFRDMLWRIGCWNTDKLQKWLDDFSPDAVYFASGDSAFTYRISLAISQSRHIPLFVSCFDDYYFNNQYKGQLGAGIAHKSFMKQVYKTMKYASCVFTVCDKMSEDYSRLFGKPCYTLYTGATIKQPFHFEPHNSRISYIGNITLLRHQQLMDIGKALKKLNCVGKPDAIDVYSSTQDQRILKHMTPENGIRFHGSIDAEHVKQVMADSMLLLHTESFDEKMRLRVAYSVSTKIADSLASGVCLLAYGPHEVASIKYLIDNEVAFCITDKKDLLEKLERIISDIDLRNQISQKASALARTNHTAEAIHNTLYKNVHKYTESWRGQ